MQHLFISRVFWERTQTCVAERFSTIGEHEETTLPVQALSQNVMREAGLR